MVQFGIHPRVMFLLFPLSGDMEHGMRKGIILVDVLECRSSRGLGRVSLLGPVNSLGTSESLRTWLISY